jgi:autotransporter-associated beta strand protein
VIIPRALLCHLLVAGALFPSAPADAATYTWDANGAAAGVTDGAGTWNTTAGNNVWWDGAVNSSWSNSGPHDAIFGSSNGVAGTVVIGTAIVVRNLTFNPASSGNYVLQGAANTAANSITLSGAAPTITTNASATIAALVNSTNGFVKEGLGTLTLKGSTANFTQNVIGGTITVNAGTLVIGPQNNNSSGEGAFQGNLTLANLGRFRGAQGDIISNTGRITVGADAFADFPAGGESRIGGLAGAGRISIPGGSVLTPQFGTHDFTGVISGTGGIFVVSGNPVNQILSGANLHTGNTSIQGGAGNSLTLNNVNAVQYSTLAGFLSNTKLFLTVPGAQTYNLGALQTAGDFDLGQNSFSIGASNLSGLSDAILSGTGGVTKLGSGTQTFRAANLYTGATDIGGGTLDFKDAGSLSTSSPVTFIGTAQFLSGGGFSNTAGIRTFGTLTRSAGNATINSTLGGTSASLTFNSLTARTAGATANFVVSGGTNGSTNKIVLSDVTTNAFIDHGTFFNGDNFAWNDAAGYVRAMRYSGPADAGAVTSTGATSLASATHQQITGAVTAQADATFSTLKIAGAVGFTLAPAQTITVDSILKTGANATLSGGAGIQASAFEDLVIRVNATNDAITINTPILANDGALVKAGLGSLTLGPLAVNTYNRNTYVNEGTLIFSQDSHFGQRSAGPSAPSNRIVLNGGTLQPAANVVLSANHGIDIGPAGGAIFGNGFGVTLGSGNMLSGSGPLAITGSSNTNTVLTSSATQEYTGRITIGANSFFAGRIALGADNLTDPFGTGDITVITGGAGSAVYVNRPGSVWNNRFTISGNGAEGRGAIRTQQGGTFHGDIILAANAGINSDGAGTTTTLNGNISGQFALTLGGLTGANATNKYVLTGNNVHSSTTIGLGITNIDHDIALGAYNGTTTLHGNATLQAGADGIVLNPDRSIALSGGVSGRHYIDVQDHDMTILGVITGSASETLVIRGTGHLRLPGANTYAGPTLIEGGTVNVPILGNPGVPGGFGPGPGGSVAPTVILSGATIEYDAPQPATTAVHIVIGGESGNTGRIESNAPSEEHALTIANPAPFGFAGTGAVTVEFGGENTGNNTVGSPIPDRSPAEPTTVIVTEEATWVFAVPNTYTGETRVEGGRLVLASPTPNTAIPTDGMVGTIPDIRVTGGRVEIARSEQIGDTASIDLSAGSFGFAGIDLTETIDTFRNTGGDFDTGANTVRIGGTLYWADGTSTVAPGGEVSSRRTQVTGGTNTVEREGRLQVESGAGSTGLVFGGTASPTIRLVADATTPGVILLQQDVTVDNTLTSGTAEIRSEGPAALPGRIDMDNGTRTFAVHNGSADVDLNLSASLDNGAVVFAGPGTTSLTGRNTYAGSTEVREARVVLDSPALNGAIPTDDNTSTTADIIIDNGGRLEIARSEQIGDGGSVDLRTGAWVQTGIGDTETIDRFRNTGGDFNTGANTTAVNTVIWAGGISTIAPRGEVSSRHVEVTDGTNTVEREGRLQVESGGGSTGLVFGGTASPTIRLAADATTPGEIILRQDVTVDNTLTSGTAEIRSEGPGALPGRVDLDDGTRTFAVHDGSAAVDLDVSASLQNGGVIKTGEGTLRFTGENIYTDPTEVRAGRLVLASPTPNTAIPTDGMPGTIPDIRITGGRVVIAGSEQIGDTASVEVVSGSLGFAGSGLTETIHTLQVSGDGSVVTDANTLEVIGPTVTLSGGTTTISTGGLISDKHWVVTGGTNTVQPDGLLRVQSGTGTTGLFLGGTASPTITLVSDSASPGEILLRQDVTVDGTLTAGTAQILNSGAAAFAGRIDMNGDTRIWAVNNGSAAVDLLVSASIQNGALTKTDAGTMKLTGTNTFTGATNIGGGTLEAGGPGTLSATANVVVNIGGTLLLSGSGARINDSANFTLAGGTFRTAGLTETVGALTLSANSIIDFGTGASANSLIFADSSALSESWTGTLSIYNWTGSPFVGGGPDHLFFGTNGSGLSGDQLDQISFFSGPGTGFLGTGGILGNGEIVPVPEPTGTSVALALLGLIGWRERRKSQVSLRTGRTAFGRTCR